MYVDKVSYLSRAFRAYTVPGRLDPTIHPIKPEAPVHNINIEGFTTHAEGTATYVISLRSEVYTRKSSKDPSAQKHWFHRDLVLVTPINLGTTEVDEPWEYDTDIVVVLPAGAAMLDALRDLLGLSVYARLLFLDDQPNKGGHLEFKIDDAEHRAIIQQLRDDLANPVD